MILPLLETLGISRSLTYNSDTILALGNSYGVLTPALTESTLPTFFYINIFFCEASGAWLFGGRFS